MKQPSGSWSADRISSWVSCSWFRHKDLYRATIIQVFLQSSTNDRFYMTCFLIFSPCIYAHRYRKFWALQRSHDWPSLSDYVVLKSILMIMYHFFRRPFYLGMHAFMAPLDDTSTYEQIFLLYIQQDLLLQILLWAAARFPVPAFLKLAACATAM